MTPEQQNPILARFASADLMVAPQQREMVFASINGLSSHPDFAQMMNDTAAAPDNFWPEADSWRAALRPYAVRDGILHIPIKGMLLHDFPWAVGSWATGYDYIWRAFQRGCEDFKAGNIKGIALVVNSPGGFVAGCWDAVDRMLAAKEEAGVPVRTFVHEHAYSAAYGHATVGDKIIISRTGGAGSIGTVRTHVDYSKLNERIGLTYSFIQAGEFKTDGHPDKPLSAEAEKRWTRQVRELNEIFVTAVARNRGLDAQVIRDFEAATFSASEAVSNGLADEIGPFDNALAAFAADLSNSEGDDEMSNPDKAAETAAQNEAALAAARADGVTEGQATGVSAERTRIATILESDEAKARPAAARMLAFDTDKDAAAAIVSLGKLPEEASASASGEPEPVAGAPAGMLDAAMDNTEQPNIKSNGGGNDGVDKDDPVALAKAFGLAGF